MDYSIEDVWETLIELPLPKSIDVVKLAQLYRDASGDCPFIREFKGAPCGRGRFGCWTCTVVRQDYAVKSLIQEGHIQLRPLFNFRNWLGSYRDIPNSRCSKRRNGSLGPGPFTLHARGVIFDNLLKSEREAGIRLLSVEEPKMINSMWGEDLASCEYRDNTGDRTIVKMPVN